MFTRLSSSQFFNEFWTSSILRPCQLRRPSRELALIPEIWNAASTLHRFYDSRFTIHVLSPLLLDFESRHQEPRICNRRHAATSRARHWGVGGFHNILFQSSAHRRTHFGIGRRNRLRLFREQWSRNRPA